MSRGQWKKKSLLQLYVSRNRWLCVLRIWSGQLRDQNAQQTLHRIQAGRYWTRLQRRFLLIVHQWQRCIAEYCIFMDPLDVLLEIPFTQKHFCTKLTLNVLFDSTLVVHVAQHYVFGWVPFTTFDALKILSIFAALLQSSVLFWHWAKAVAHKFWPKI